MEKSYKETIARLVSLAPLEIDTEVKVEGRPPTTSSSEFLINKEQGDWAEDVVFRAVNENSTEFIALKYGRADTLSAGDAGFSEFYREYQEELNTIGKRPDLLIFRRSDIPEKSVVDLSKVEIVKKAIAAIEVRSSSFLANRYSTFMNTRTQDAESKCEELIAKILEEPYASLLKQKNPAVHSLMQGAHASTFRELDFRLSSWVSSPQLKQLSAYMKELKESIKVLHKRDYLSITPKLEDIALVNRWIQIFGVKHYYLQVFFDKAFIIPFKEILEISSNPDNEDKVFRIEKDIKNQGKTTIKINVQVGREVIGKIDMPEHKSALKELDRGRLLFYVTFSGGKGYLDREIFEKEIVNGK